MSNMRERIADYEALSELIADAIIKKTMPIKDDISELQARKSYGYAWLNKMVKYGVAQRKRIGGRWVYSRHQLDAIRAAEREEPYIKSFVKKSNKMTTL